MARPGRQASKARTRERLLDEARRLFRENGYGATSLEQIAEAAGLTKGAIYGHFSSKEDLLLTAVEATATLDLSALVNDQSRPVRERLAEAGRVLAAQAGGDRAGLAVSLELLAALLRNPDALRRLGEDHERRLEALADADPDVPRPGVTAIEVWAIGWALYLGLQLCCFIAPDRYTPEVFAHAFELLAGFYPTL